MNKRNLLTRLPIPITQTGAISDERLTTVTPAQSMLIPSSSLMPSGMRKTSFSLAMMPAK
jgi:hypothetical protein